jgi:hypothetical protein
MKRLIEKEAQEANQLQALKRRPAAKVGEPARDRLLAQRAHTVEIDLGFADPTRPLERIGLDFGAGDPARDRLGLRRKRRLAPNGNVQPVP